MSRLRDAVRSVREILFEDRTDGTTTADVGGYMIPIGGTVQRDNNGMRVITGLKAVGGKRKKRKKRS